MGSEALNQFELLVVLAAQRLGDEAHTVSITDDIAVRTGRSVRRANVYMTLQRLEAKGLITTRLGQPRPERGGKPRLLVAITSEGTAVAQATIRAIHAMLGDGAVVQTR